MAVDRQLDGAWLACEQSAEQCDARFHLPELSVEQAQALPLGMLLPLLEVLDPPTGTPGGTKVWELPGGAGIHRQYGLPAVIERDGSMQWLVQGVRHRGADLPAIVRPSGRLEWWVDGKLHRDGGPAIIFPTGRQLWYEQDRCIGEGPNCTPIDYSQGRN